MNIGLVLSGGMAKGAYQIGALKALQEFVPLQDVKYISAASVGVLNAYAYATGQLAEAEDMWNNLCEDNTRFFITEILRSSLLQQNIRKLYDPEKPIHADFYCSLLNLERQTLVYKNLKSVKSESIPRYLKASVAMPIYNKAVQIGQLSFYDGAMVDNIPVYPLMKHNLDYIICVYFDDISYKFENTYFDNKVIKITFPQEKGLKPSLFFRRESIAEMIDAGYRRTTKILSAVFADGYQEIDGVYDAIERNNGTGRSYTLRITGDLLVTNLNKVAQKFAKRKIIK